MICGEAPQVCQVHGVHGELQQVLLNLLVNALQAMPGGGALHVDLDIIEAAHPDAGGALRAVARVSVRDTGHGIAPEDLDRVFEAFYTTKPVGEGTGLGLTVSTGIVREHGGWMTVSSAVGEGSTFGVLLPLIDDRT